MSVDGSRSGGEKPTAPREKIQENVSAKNIS
jgi:hypothetical protein